jgi:hypothetical protein
MFIGFLWIFHYKQSSYWGTPTYVETSEIVKVSTSIVESAYDLPQKKTYSDSIYIYSNPQKDRKCFQDSIDGIYLHHFQVSNFSIYDLGLLYIV